MRKIKIVADSSSDIFALDNIPYASTPMKISTDEREFVDDSNLNVAEMVEYLYNYKGKSKSSCPNVNDWLEAFSDADDILCLTITSGLSGSYNSALVAKEIFESENEGKRVHVFDSLSAGPEIVLVIEKMKEYIEKGLAFEEICERIHNYMKKTGLMFMLKSLKNFANNGRISPVVAKLVGIAGICIVGKASEEGTLELMEKCRGEKRAISFLVDSLEAAGFKSGKISISHSENESAAIKMKELILEKFANSNVEIHKCHGLCSFYAEKGGILVGFEKE